MFQHIFLHAVRGTKKTMSNALNRSFFAVNMLSCSSGLRNFLATRIPLPWRVWLASKKEHLVNYITLKQTTLHARDTVQVIGLFPRAIRNPNVVDAQLCVEKFSMTLGCPFHLGQKIRLSQEPEKLNMKSTFLGNTKYSVLTVILKRLLTQ